MDSPLRSDTIYNKDFLSFFPFAHTISDDWYYFCISLLIVNLYHFFAYYCTCIVHTVNTLPRKILSK